MNYHLSQIMQFRVQRPKGCYFFLRHDTIHLQLTIEYANLGQQPYISGANFQKMPVKICKKTHYSIVGDGFIKIFLLLEVGQARAASAFLNSPWYGHQVANLSLTFRPLVAILPGIQNNLQRMVQAISFFSLRPRAFSLNQFMRL